MSHFRSSHVYGYVQLAKRATHYSLVTISMQHVSRSIAGVVLGAIALSTPLISSADTVVDIAVGNPQFSSLVSAVTSQDLAGTLSGTGPFTVFAPTNDAFAALPGFITRAVQEKPALLKDILLYHVVADDLDATEVLSSRMITTILGDRITPNMRGGAPYINGSKITATDITADNGRVHVIDKVLIPRSVAIEAFRIEVSRIQKEVAMILSDLRLYGSGNAAQHN